MGNPWAGEITLTIDGERHKAKLTLGALAQLEEELDGENLIALVERFETGKPSARDILALIVAGLRGGGWAGDESDLLTADIGGGVLAASKMAAQLLLAAFAPSDR